MRRHTERLIKRRNRFLKPLYNVNHNVAYAFSSFKAYGILVLVSAALLGVLCLAVSTPGGRLLVFAVPLLMIMAVGKWLLRILCVIVRAVTGPFAAVYDRTRKRFAKYYDGDSISQDADFRGNKGADVGLRYFIAEEAMRDPYNAKYLG